MGAHRHDILNRIAVTGYWAEMLVVCTPGQEAARSVRMDLRNSREATSLFLVDDGRFCIDGRSGRLSPVHRCKRHFLNNAKSAMGSLAAGQLLDRYAKKLTFITEQRKMSLLIMARFMAGGIDCQFVD